MKAILVVIVMAQYQVDAGQMLLVKGYSATACASQSQTEEKYLDVGACVNFGSSSASHFYLGIVCNAENQATVTKYLDSACANRDTNFSQHGYISGMHNAQGGVCAETSSSSWETHMCAAVDTVTYTRYTDSACTTAAGPALATGMRVINSCEYDTSGGSNGTSTVTGEKATILANGSTQVSTYANNACTGSGTVVATINPNTCTPDSDKEGLWFKWVPSTATASKTTFQHGFLAFPLFMGVATILF
jgi:hypothetical protein